MIVLVALVLGCVLLYFWLLGHWFSRALMFLALAFLLSFGLIGFAANNQGTTPTFILATVFGTIIAWPISGIPAYYWRSQIREQLRLRDELERADQQAARTRTRHLV